MSLALENFVDVKIKRKSTGQNNLTYDTVIYVSPGSDAPVGYYIGGTAKTDADGTKDNPFDVSKLKNNPKKWANVFFANGGKYIHFVSDIEYDQSSKRYNYVNSSTTEHLPVPTTEIIIAGTNGPSELISEGINQKIFLCGTSADISGEGIVTVTSSLGGNDLVTAPMAAYYTQIDINNPNTIKDYCFTVVKDDADNDLGLKAEDEGNSNTAIVENDNYIAYLAGAYRNIGGDDTVGIDITNTFMKIVLQQVLTNTLMNLLVSKIKLDSSGIIAVKNATSKVMTQFVNNGYISTEKAWPDEDLYIDNELVAEKDTPLIDGYKIHVSPITQDDIKNHQIPTVYIVYGDQVGVRKITISGEVF